MIVIGAKAHAKEVLMILEENQVDDLVFYDDIAVPARKDFFGKYKILNDIEAAMAYLSVNNRFGIGIGGTHVRKRIVERFESIGGRFTSIIAKSASVGNHEVVIGEGCNIMCNTFVSNSVSLGKGVLLNRGASIHHDVTIGHFCEISPGATVLGRAVIGECCSVGASATILPDVTVGNNVMIAAGAVVINDVSDNVMVAGVPAVVKREFLDTDI